MITLYTAIEIRQRLAILDAAILSGVKTVVIGDETIVYQDLSDLIKARAIFAEQLLAVEGVRSDRMSLAVFGNE